MSMLRLRDRITVAMGANMGITLSPEENVRLAELLVHVEQLLDNDSRSVGGRNNVVDSAVRLFGHNA